MKVFWSLVRRNIKLFFKDRTFFFVAMISPIILLLLFVTFLGSIYKGSFLDILNSFETIVDAGLVDSTVIVYLFSSLLSVSCVTVAFCCNVMSIQDKINGVDEDFKITPTSKVAINFSYLVSTFIVSSFICLVIFVILLMTTLCMGHFYFNLGNILGGIASILLLCLFGAIFSSIVCYFCSTEAQVNAITATTSACYGFLCGAYMPISQFTSGIGNFISILPGTHGTALLKNHLMSGYLVKMQENGAPIGAIEAIKEGFDLKLSLFGNEVSINALWIVIVATVIILSIVFVVLSVRKKNK